MGVPVVIGGDNLPSPVGIRLIDLTNIGGGGGGGEATGPPGPPSSDVPAINLSFKAEVQKVVPLIGATAQATCLSDLTIQKAWG